MIPDTHTSESSLPSQLEGTVEHLHDSGTFGFIRGDDQRQYFFIPSSMTPKEERRITSVSVNSRVIGEPYMEPGKGLRMRNIRNISVRQS